jgi:hypothetical protein
MVLAIGMAKDPAVPDERNALVRKAASRWGLLPEGSCLREKLNEEGSVNMSDYEGQRSDTPASDRHGENH